MGRRHALGVDGHARLGAPFAGRTITGLFERAMANLGAYLEPNR